MHCLLTCSKEVGLVLKSMSPKNISSFGSYFGRLVSLNSNHMTGVTHPPALFTSDQVSLLQLSKNWGERREGTGKTITHKLTLRNKTRDKSLDLAAKNVSRVWQASTMAYRMCMCAVLMRVVQSHRLRLIRLYTCLIGMQTPP